MFIEGKSKKYLWGITFAIIITLFFAIGVSGAWFTSTRTGQTGVKIGPGASVLLNTNNQIVFSVSQNTNPVNDSKFADKVRVKIETTNALIFKVDWNFEIFAPDSENIGEYLSTKEEIKTQTELEALSGDELTKAIEINAVYNRFAQGNVSEIHVQTANAEENYFIYSSSSKSFYYSNISTTLQTIDFTTDQIRVWRQTPGVLDNYLFKLTFQIKPADATTISDASVPDGWDWNDIPSTLQSKIATFQQTL